MIYHNDSKRFVAAMVWLAEKFPRTEGPRVLSKSELADYFEALRGLSIGALEYAAELHFKTKQFFPKPVELIDAAHGYQSEVLRLPEYVPILPPGLRDQYAKDAAEVMNMMWTNAPKAHKQAAIDAMERAYPGLGWKEAQAW